jgi:hypothetical protein
MIELTDKILSLNEKANQLFGYKSNDIITNIASLNKNKSVVVGYRTSCGTDNKTSKVFQVWKKAILEINKQGVDFNTKNLIVKNGSPTMSGGFWNEIEYSIK